MKLKYIYTLVLAALMTACTEDFTDWANPQHNDQLETVTFGNGSVTEVGLIDFANIADNQEWVKVCNIVAPTANSDKYKYTSYTLNFGNTHLSINEDGQILTSALKQYVVDNFGKAPVEREMTATVEQWISDGTTAIKTATSGEFTIKAKLVAPYISEHYYLIGGPTEWNPMCTTLPFTHSDKGVYDDPIFTVIFTVSAGETWFAITDDKTLESGEWSDVLGCAEGNGNNGMEGFIGRRCDLGNDGSWKIVADDECTVKMTINMMDYSYQIELIPMSSFYYVVGGVQGWSDQNRTHIFFPGAEPKVYTYTTKWTGAWDLKFWSAADFGNWDKAIGCAVDGCADPTGGLVFSGAQAISAPSAEYYTFSINMANNTYTWTKLDNQSPTEYESISLIGDFNGWGGDIDLQQVCAHNWYVETEIPSTGGLKFRANHDWATNWGVKMDLYTQSFAVGVADGPNISVPAGTYRFYLNDITGDIAIVPVGEMQEPDPVEYTDYIYFIGATDGWANAEQRLALTDAANGTYTGFIYCADPNGWGNQFKFQQIPGDWGSAIGADNLSTFSGDAVNPDNGGNIGVTAGESVYYFSVSLGKGEIYAEKVGTMGIIGDFNGWGGDLEMTWDAANYCFVADITSVTVPGWKFRLNAGWDINLGGDSTEDLFQNGANLNLTGTICKLYPTRRDSDKIYCTVE